MTHSCEENHTFASICWNTVTAHSFRHPLRTKWPWTHSKLLPRVVWPYCVVWSTSHPININFDGTTDCISTDHRLRFDCIHIFAPARLHSPHRIRPVITEHFRQPPWEKTTNQDKGKISKIQSRNISSIISSDRMYAVRCYEYTSHEDTLEPPEKIPQHFIT